MTRKERVRLLLLFLALTIVKNLESVVTQKVLEPKSSDTTE